MTPETWYMWWRATSCYTDVLELPHASFSPAERRHVPGKSYAHFFPGDILFVPECDDPAQIIREHGYNPRLKTHCWKIATQLLKARGRYADLYYQFKDVYSRREDLKNKKGSFKLHVHLMAMRKVINVFLQHLWVRWREFEGLPTSKPYVIEKLGHASFMEPFTEKPS